MGSCSFGDTSERGPKASIDLGAFRVNTKINPPRSHVGGGR